MDTRTTDGPTPKRIALARFHDGKAKANWGGRGTSLALAGLLASRSNTELVQPINGEFITAGFGEFTRVDKLKVRCRYAPNYVRKARPVMPTRPFPRVLEYADRILLTNHRNARAQSIVESISECDEFWMNGEGDFIMGYSGTLWRSLIMMAIAQRLGKPTVLVNSILSARGDGTAEPSVIDGVGSVLEKCSAIIYRDPVSLELSRKWFPQLSASWLPDALFGWSEWNNVVGSSYSPDTEGLPLSVQSLLRESDRIISISGSSVMREWSQLREQRISSFVQNLIANQFQPVMVATSDEDAWLERVAVANQVPFVPANVPLKSGMQLLSASQAFVSGRYHPSILSACVGTPLVTFGSNSHKTLSLLQVLGKDDPVCYPTFDEQTSVELLTDATLTAARSASDYRDELQGQARRCAAILRQGLESTVLF
ncbi:polysaccharide pyruvyl transferase family protein [Pseudarthrobacter enclensis]|uniref:polysaccharide pyruvyl transferase family protein n=1 Tax=Pseudarthrobacter enclensis TaxID=993070 RepID=UPI00130EEAA5|nr:polysaccharide pyruvyl transferase family protein [Pseudarthrobacter enclensis]